MLTANAAKNETTWIIFIEICRGDAAIEKMQPADFTSMTLKYQSMVRLTKKENARHAVARATAWVFVRWRPKGLQTAVTYRSTAITNVKKREPSDVERRIIRVIQQMATPLIISDWGVIQAIRSTKAWIIIKRSVLFWCGLMAYAARMMVFPGKPVMNITQKIATLPTSILKLVMFIQVWETALCCAIYTGMFVRMTSPWDIYVLERPFNK